MTIAAILKEKGSDVVSVTPDTTVAQIAQIISSRRIGAVIVLGAGGELAGIVSERDVVKALAAKAEAVDTLRAEQIMTREVTVAEPSTTVEEAMEIMDHGYFRHLPVVDGGKLVGIISIRDAVKARLRRHEDDEQNLRSYIHGRM
ncbi:MAG: CBS domain-containing protein [Acetobacteraceae bacterium]|nr:CBS domain-containing protein [Acetobacteraceae bacterium]